MNLSSLQQWRYAVRTGVLPPELVDELRSVVRGLVRRRRLPPSFAPYGQWNDEAADEVFQAWYVERLLGQGHLQLLLDRSRTADGFRGLAERSLRQHLLQSRDRSQADNLYRRVVAVLSNSPSFRVVQDAVRSQNRWYALTTAPQTIETWAGDDRHLIAHGWALGDFVVIRYRAAAAKLSPVLDADELERFVQGLLGRVGRALTPALVMRVLAARFDLGEVELVPDHEGSAVAAPASSTDYAVIVRDLARSIMAELTPRQLEILRRSEKETVADIAVSVGCSVGTVVNEQRRVGQLFSRMTDGEDEREQLLNIVVDLSYMDNDDEDR